MTPLSCISSTAMSQSRVSKVKVDTDSNVSRLLVTIFPLWKSSHISPIIIKIFPIEVDPCHFIHTTFKFRPCLFLMLGVRCWCESPCPTARAPHSGKLTIIPSHKNYFLIDGMAGILVLDVSSLPYQELSMFLPSQTTAASCFWRMGRHTSLSSLTVQSLMPHLKIMKFIC